MTDDWEANYQARLQEARELRELNRRNDAAEDGDLIHQRRVEARRLAEERHDEWWAGE